MNCYTHANLAVEGEEAKMEHLRGLGGPSENSFWASLKILCRLQLSCSENIAWASLEPLWKYYLNFTVAALLNTSKADSTLKQVNHNVEFLFKCITRMWPPPARMAQLYMVSISYLSYQSWSSFWCRTKWANCIIYHLSYILWPPPAGTTR